MMDNLELRPLSLDDVLRANAWRNKQLAMLRTSRPLTTEQQMEFYQRVVCDRSASARFWGVWCGVEFIGLVGIENIQWENRIGEISLITDLPQHQEGALRLILNAGFNSLNLRNLYTEVYDCSPRQKFWFDQFNNYNGATLARLPERKFYNGYYYDGQYINFNREAFA